jgi:hypothetical protein
MAEFEIQGPTRVCAASGRELRPGDRFVGVLTAEGGTFVRRDYAAEAWPGPLDGALAYWSGKVPADDRPHRPFVNEAVLLDCFDRLAAATEPDGLNFRYVAALLLMRKKRLKFEDVVRDESGRDVLLVRDSRGGAVHRVIDPHLTDDQIAAVQAEVFRVLGWQ